MAKIRNYSSIADIQSFWISDIATQFFDFDDTNNYKVGLFGYINEVMSTVTQDAFNTINIAKREFYAASAEHINSFYKMAGNYDINVPLVVPGKADIVLFIAEGDIIRHGSLANGTYTFILDNTMEIYADTIQFTLDYPIRIMARYQNGKYAYTTYYETSKNNSLASTTTKYIQNKCVAMNGVRYLAMSVSLQQYTITNSNQNITRNSYIEATNLIFDYDGDLAGFDIYYTENPGVSVERFIPKYDINDTTPAGEYCIYEFLADNKIRITFPYNPYFSPKINSEIRCAIYTSMGSDGEFDEFLGELTCTPQSEEYGYNNGLIVRGIVSGDCKGSVDKLEEEDFKRDVKYAVKTNNTITTASDLSEYFIDRAADKDIRVEFEKHRDDVLERLYKSFVLIKDEDGNVIPTNSCNLFLKKSQFDEIIGDRGIIKPGKVLKYLNDHDNTVVFSDYKLIDDLSSIMTQKQKEITAEINALKAEKNTIQGDVTRLTEINNEIKKKENEFVRSGFLFTNPFLISVSMKNGIVGYYGNAISEIHSTEFTFVEDRAFNQFICLGIQIDRNPIAGEKYYSFTVKISSSSDLAPEELIVVNDPSLEENQIRAKYDGVIASTFYKDGAVYYTIQYNLDDGTIETEDIQVSTYSIANVETREFTYQTGYKMNFDVLDTFVAGDIIATKKVDDLGRLRACIDVEDSLINNTLYIPLYIEDYDAEKDAYVLRAYVSTNDYISLNHTITLDSGIYNNFGVGGSTIAIPMEDTQCTVSIFFKNDDTNYTHNMWQYEFFRNYTLTNKYTTPASEAFCFAKGISFFRSNLKFSDGADVETFTARGNGIVETIFIENYDVYAKITYDTPISSIDGEGNTIETVDYDTILLKSGIAGSSGNITYTKEYEMKYDVGERFTANSTLATRKGSITEDSDDFEMTITLSPLTRADWIKDYDKYNFIINKIYNTYDVLDEAYYQLENQFGIAMSLFNTYGRSLRYLVGNSKEMVELGSVNCEIFIGVEVDAMTNTTLFLEKFKSFLKEKIESFNDVDEKGKSLFMIDLLASAKEEFPEIQHLEYYGFNDKGTEAQVIAPKDESVTADYLDKFVPEFINVETEEIDGVIVPKIHVSILNDTALV